MDVIPRENVYGHLQRLSWLKDHLRQGDRVVEFGCGTGRLITLPLRAWGFDVTGVDLDEVSIEQGRALLHDAGLDPDALQAVDLGSLSGAPSRSSSPPKSSSTSTTASSAGPSS